MNRKEFEEQYLGIWEIDPNAPVKRYCGECSYFQHGACTTSELEAKYGSGSTPACSDFIPKETK